MKTFIIYDSRRGFQQDISAMVMVEGYPIRPVMVKNFEEFVVAAGNTPDAILVISDTSLDDYDAARIQSRAVFGYASVPDGIRVLQDKGISCIGLLKTSKQLLDTLVSPVLPVMQNGGNAVTAKLSPGSYSPSRTPPSAQQVSMPQAPTLAKVSPPSPEPAQAPAKPVQEPAPSVSEMPTMPGMTPEQMMQMFAMFQAMQGGQVAPVAAPSPVIETIRDQSNLREVSGRTQDAEASAGVEQDLMRSQMEKKKTRVVSVYAAKGGVGKTTISAELAVCLALTSNGRRKFRVCIVDYNIDFGDVASTLNLDEKGPNMSYWAEEIRSSLSAGEDPDTLSYSRRDMEQYYLQQVDKRFDAYALIAPTMHEDSMFIKSAELEIMLRNIIENGEFDYVICDTGNNTRDASVLATEMAEYVLLVATQDVTTANCNASVLRALRDTGFDTEKVRLVVNNVMPSRETGISVQEVEETFSYQCVCRIKRTPDIIRANNTGKPLVLYQPNHDYTKQIRRIVSFVTTGEVVHDEPKRGLFGFLRKK